MLDSKCSQLKNKATDESFMNTPLRQQIFSEHLPCPGSVLGAGNGAWTSVWADSPGEIIKDTDSGSTGLGCCPCFCISSHSQETTPLLLTDHSSSKLLEDCYVLSVLPYP